MHKLQKAKKCHTIHFLRLFDKFILVVLNSMSNVITVYFPGTS